RSKRRARNAYGSGAGHSLGGGSDGVQAAGTHRDRGGGRGGGAGVGAGGGGWTHEAPDVSVRDLETGVTTHASPHPPVDFSCCTTVDALSADGTEVLFHSTLNNLTSLPDTNGGYDYFVRDLVA